MPAASSAAQESDAVGSLVGDAKPIPNPVPKFGTSVMSLAGSDEDDELQFEALDTSRTWRREVINNGRYWIFRKGSGKKREYKFGGKFATLPKERQAQYYVNRESYRFYREQAAARDGRSYRPRNAGKRDDIFH